LKLDIESITGIDFDAFESGHAGIAQKMAWAAKRNTSRVEDKSYCLMGLFGIHMPLIYGEGESAFLRLQLEIMKISDDDSIFAWEDDGFNRGLLATSIFAFKDAGNIKPRIGSKYITSYAMSQKGIQVTCRLITTVSGDLILPLSCSRAPQFRLGVPLGQWTKTLHVRTRGNLELYHPSFMPMPTSPQEIYVLDNTKTCVAPNQGPIRCVVRVTEDIDENLPRIMHSGSGDAIHCLEEGASTVIDFVLERHKLWLSFYNICGKLSHSIGTYSAFEARATGDPGVRVRMLPSQQIDGAFILSSRPSIRILKISVRRQLKMGALLYVVDVQPEYTTRKEPTVEGSTIRDYGMQNAVELP